MDNNKPLQQQNILVTRPRHQAEAFCQQLEQQGARVYRLPVIEIQAIEPDTRQLSAASHCDILIFTSSNAVQHWHTQTAGKLPASCQVAAIGKKTAQTLQQYHIRVDLLPTQDFNSESLLALPALHALRGKKIAIIKGTGGRQHLQHSLQARGAIVHPVPVYTRQLPCPDQALLTSLQHANIDIITLTSAESGSNLFTLLDNGQTFPWLATATLLLGSQRIQSALRANRKNLKNPIQVANNPSDSAMLTKLLEISTTRHLQHTRIANKPDR